MPMRIMQRGEVGRSDLWADNSQREIDLLPLAEPHDGSAARKEDVTVGSASALSTDNSMQQSAAADLAGSASSSQQQSAQPAATKPATENKPAPVARGGDGMARSGLVVIDPGHGGKDIGANRTFPDGYFMKESDLNLKIALKLASRLRSKKFEVILTRETDAPVNNPARDRTGDGVASGADELQARVDAANNAKADLFVSVHLNSAASQMGGTEVFYCPDHPFADKSRKMAELLQNSLLDGIRSLGYNPPNRGVKVDTESAARTHLYVLGPKTSIIAKPIAVPSVLGEALFISNLREGELLRDDKTLDTIAEAYARAVVQYFDWLGQ